MHVSAHIVQAQCVRRFLLHLVRTASVRRGGLAVISCCSCLVVVFVPADAVYAAVTYHYGSLYTSSGELPLTVPPVLVYVPPDSTYTPPPDAAA